MRTRIYNYHPVTKEYIEGKYPSFAQEDPKDPGNVPVPANATVIAPPSVDEHEVAVFDGAGWTVEKDYRGTVYLTTEGEVVKVYEIGFVPPEYKEKETEEILKNKAAKEKEAELEGNWKRLAKEPFEYEGNKYLLTYEDLFFALQALEKLKDADPIPTFQGTDLAGMWETFGGDYVAFTKDGFMALTQAYVGERQKQKEQYRLALEQLKALKKDKQKTAKDILSFSL